MNYDKADLSDPLLKINVKNFGVPKPGTQPPTEHPGIKKRRYDKIIPVMTAKKTFEQFQEENVYSTKQFTKFGKSNYPKNTPFVIDDFVKNRAKELFKFKTGIPLAKNKSNNVKA